MTKKIVFLDVDGTLCDDAGNVPESARQAITAAHKKGHEFFLCTGRSKAEITEDVLALPLSDHAADEDGLVPAAAIARCTMR